MPKIISHAPGMDLESAKNKLKDAFFQLADENFLALPDVKRFIYSYPTTAPKKFDMAMHATLKKPTDGSGKSTFMGVVICKDTKMPYLKINYEHQAVPC